MDAVEFESEEDSSSKYLALGDGTTEGSQMDLEEK